MREPKIARSTSYSQQLDEIIARAIHRAIEDHRRLRLQMDQLVPRLASADPDGPDAERHAESLMHEWAALAADVAAVAPAFREIVMTDESGAILLISYAGWRHFGEPLPINVPIAVRSPLPKVNDLRAMVGLPRKPGRPADPDMSKSDFEQKTRDLLRAKDADGRWLVPTVDGLIRTQELADAWGYSAEALEDQMHKLGIDWIAIRDQTLRERGFRIE